MSIRVGVSSTELDAEGVVARPDADRDREGNFALVGDQLVNSPGAVAII